MSYARTSTLRRPRPTARVGLHNMQVWYNQLPRAAVSPAVCMCRFAHIAKARESFVFFGESFFFFRLRKCASKARIVHRDDLAGGHILLSLLRPVLKSLFKYPYPCHPMELRKP